MADARAVLHLSPFDQTIGRIYVRKLYGFAFPHDALRPRAILALRRGIQAAVARWPFLAGHVAPARNGPHLNGVDLIYHTRPRHPDADDGSGILTIRVLSPVEFPWNYADLVDAGVPPSALRKEDLSAVPEHPGPDDTRPAFSVQANFFPGGLILCVASHHSVFDGNSVRQFLVTFAHAIRNPDSVQHAGEQVPKRLDYSATVAAQDCRGASLETLSEFAARPATLTSSPRPPRATTRVLTFAASTIDTLKADVTAHVHRIAGPDAWVSTFNCVAALVWVAVVRARRARVPPSATVRLGCAVDIRQKHSPRLPSEYFGNAIVHTVAVATASELLDHSSSLDAASPDAGISPATIAHAAARIRAALAAVDDAYVKQRLCVFSRLADPTHVPRAYKAALDMPSTGLDLSSWLDQGADVDFGIPGCDPPAPQWVRKTFSAHEGVVNILPRKGGSRGGEAWEVLLGLSADDMSTVCAPQELGAWTLRVVE